MITEEQKAKIFELHAQGMVISRITREVGLPNEQSVYYQINKEKIELRKKNRAKEIETVSNKTNKYSIKVSGVRVNLLSKKNLEDLDVEITNQSINITI